MHTGDCPRAVTHQLGARVVLERPRPFWLVKSERIQKLCALRQGRTLGCCSVGSRQHASSEAPDDQSSLILQQHRETCGKCAPHLAICLLAHFTDTSNFAVCIRRLRLTSETGPHTSPTRARVRFDIQSLSVTCTPPRQASWPAPQACGGANSSPT